MNIFLAVSNLRVKVSMRQYKVILFGYCGYARFQGENRKRACKGYMFEWFNFDLGIEVIEQQPLHAVYLYIVLYAI